MALPTLDSVFASAADLPRRQMLAKWLVNLQYSGSVEDYYTLPEKYLYAKIAVAAGASRSEADYISLPDRYVWSDIYKAVSGSSANTIDRGEKEALGWIAAAVRGDTADPAKVATYISWPWRYQVASIITSLAVDADAQSFVTNSGATDTEGIDQFVKGVKNLGLWNSMVCWPLRSSQNAGTGTTAYSLGGLGTFNGTLVNGPTWEDEGVNFPRATATHISATRPIGSSAADAYSIFSVHTQLVEDANYRALWLGRDASNDRMFVRTTADAFNASGVGLPAPSSINGAHSTALTAGSGNTGKAVSAWKDGAISGSTTGDVTGTNSVYYIGGLAGDNTRSFGFPVAFNGAFNLELSSAQVAALHTLYKSTLGTGLGLS